MITKSVIRPSTAGGGSGGAKLPSNLLHLSGTIRDEAVDWSAGATCVAVVEMSGANSVSDTQISGGLWATATGLEFRDGSGHVAKYPHIWADGDTLVPCLAITAEGKMKLGLMREFEIMYDDGEIMYDNSQIMYEVQ